MGGRLRHASLSMEQKHPMVLPAKHIVTGSIIREEHVRLHHCPQEQLLSAVRHRFWPISGRREVRKAIKNCLNCFRFRPAILDLKVGDLPKERIRACARPFACTGIDYAGPLQVRESKRRGRVNLKVTWPYSRASAQRRYIWSLSLTTEAFLAAMSRFTARRKLCSQIFSDNGTNFMHHAN